MYDFQNDITTICDIDFYQKKPLINKLGEMYWGSPRFKAPEESELNALIDERANVYTMGAIAFGLLGGETNHSLEKWEDKNKRYSSVSEFYCEWIKFASM
ncbi:MAG: hypothetical protein RSD02_09070 [Niameybacter sp.]